MQDIQEELLINGWRFVREDRVGASGAPEELYTAAQVAEMAHVSARRVYQLMDEGIIGYVIPNGCTKPRLVKRSEYERWTGLST